MWPFKKKKPPIVIERIGQLVMFPPHKETFVIREINYRWLRGQCTLNIEAVDQDYINTHYATPKGDNLLDMF